nr:MAG TPA: hypothetical protein [Caudoviricetes sp.]
MSDKQSNLTDKEMEDLQGIVTDTLNRYLYKGKRSRFLL